MPRKRKQPTLKLCNINVCVIARRDVRLLRAAAQDVVDTWESGDLAGAVRRLQEALDETASLIYTVNA